MPWRISDLLSAVSPKEPPEKGWSAHALSFDLQVFTCHGYNRGNGGRRRISRGTVTGEPGKGVFRQDGRRVFERGGSVTPRELAGRTPFPECDRRSPPWCRRPPPTALCLPNAVHQMPSAVNPPTAHRQSTLSLPTASRQFTDRPSTNGRFLRRISPAAGDFAQKYLYLLQRASSP